MITRMVGDTLLMDREDLARWLGRPVATIRAHGDARDMISTKQATRLYKGKVTYAKLRRWAKDGRLCAPERRGRELYWNAVEIEQLLNILGDNDRKYLPRRPAARGA